MAKDEIRNGQREYGIVHVNEEEMRAAGHGVFGAKAIGGAPANKMTAAPADKSEPSDSMKKTELVAMAEAEGVKLDGTETKADLIAKIETSAKRKGK